MFVRNRNKPLPLVKLDALISRLPPQHSELPTLQKQAAKYQKGYNGERKLDYYLQSLPSKFYILSDVGLSIFDKTIQIDSLIISPYAIYIIESKNMEGTIIFDTALKQLIHIRSNNKAEGYKYPITQVEIVSYHLKYWFNKQKITVNFPIYYFVSIADTNTIIRVEGEEGPIKNVVSHVEDIPLRIMNIDDQLGKVKKENMQLRNKIVNQIIQKCVDFDYDVLEKYSIQKQDVLPGVHCSECGHLGLERILGRGRCRNCGAYSKKPYEKALYEYTLILDDTITNRKCRWFLQLNYRYEANYIIKKSGLFKCNGRTWVKK